jgi:phosphoribosylaminoimidazole-succinocarboxamide synthase
MPLTTERGLRDLYNAPAPFFLRTTMPPLLQSNVPGISCRRGKVRDVYDLGDKLAIVATDRISAFDWILPTPIPDKGRILTQMTLFWLELLGVPNHLLGTDLSRIGPAFAARQNELAGRTMLVRKATVVPIECVVRGFLAGSGWKEYRQTHKVCGEVLPLGLRESDKLNEPIFTPATKEESGHDINISFTEMSDMVGHQLAARLRDLSLEVYGHAAAYARGRGILIADTKLEWGTVPSGDILLIDEVLTPDSSRFWPADGYAPGKSQPSFDKQYVRDWLERTGWDKASPPPELPEDVVDHTRAKYVEAFERLTGQRFS